MTKEIEEKSKGITIRRQDFNNLRNADDAVILSEYNVNCTGINNICKEYGMAINVKKTKTMVISKTGNVQRKVKSMTQY